MDDLTGLGKVGVQLIQTGEKFLDKLFGPYLEERGQMLADGVRAKRNHNIARIAGLASEQVGNREIQPIPGRILFPLINAAMNEDDSLLQARWAALLAHNALHPDAVPPAYPRILAELSPQEAIVLDWVFEKSPYRDAADYLPTGAQGAPLTTLQTAMDAHNATEREMFLVLANLDRLGLVITTERPGNPIGTTEARFMHIRMTPFGGAFVRACRPDTSS